jgi:hypothetical protein
MGKYLYEVSLDGGRSNRHFQKFQESVMNLNGQSPDFGGINNLCVISHHVDAKTLKSLITNFENWDDIEIAEITKTTLLDSQCTHRMYSDLIRQYFLPYNEYPNIGRAIVTER